MSPVHFNFEKMQKEDTSSVELYLKREQTVESNKTNLKVKNHYLGICQSQVLAQ